MQHEIFPAALRARARRHGLAVSVEPIYTDPDLAIYGYAGSMRRPPVRSDLRPTLSPSSVGSIGTGVIWKFHTIRFSLVVSDVESVDGALNPSCPARRRGPRPKTRGSGPYGAGAKTRGSRWGGHDDGARTCARVARELRLTKQTVGNWHSRFLAAPGCSMNPGPGPRGRSAPGRSIAW